MEIFAQAGAVGNTFLEAIHYAGELGVGLEVWLQLCRDTPMVTLSGVQFTPRGTPDWHEFTLDDLRTRFLVDQEGQLTTYDDGRPPARPMPLQELLVRWRHYQSKHVFTRILLVARGDDFVPFVAEAVDRSKISVEHVVCSTPSIRAAVEATQLGFRTVLELPAERWWEEDAPERWRRLRGHFGRLAMSAVRGSFSQMPPTFASDLAPWRLFLDASGVSRQQFKSLKHVERVEGVICPDPVLALMA